MRWTRAVAIGIVTGSSFAASTVWAAEGVAELKGSATTPQVRGSVKLSETAEGLHIEAEVAGAPPGAHGFHIHEFGTCGEDGKAAGSHYNPQHTPHGDVVAKGPAGAHAGDLGNIEIGADGTGRKTWTVPGVTLAQGPLIVAGRAFVLHEKPDDFGQPVGNAGGRIACGPILIVGTPSS